MNKHVMMRLLPVFTVALLLGACATAPAPTPRPAPPPPQTPVAPPEIDLSAGKAACNAIAKDLSENDRKSLYARVDTHSIMDRVFAALDSDVLSQEQRKTIQQRLDEQIRGMLTVNRKHVRWDMLRGHSDGPRYLCLVRTQLNDAGLSYVEFELRQRQGELRIVDWYDLVRENRVSDSLTELFHDIGSLSAATESRMPELKRSAQLEQMLFYNFLSAVRSADAGRVLVSYDALPLRMKEKPLYALMAVNVASGRDEGRYQQALRNLAQRFGGDDHYGLLLVDLYLTDHQYGKARRVVRKFKQQVGTDPVLELLLAELERDAGSKDTFYGYCLQALDDDPAYVDTYWILLDQLVADRHYDDAVLVLNVLTRMFEFTFKENAFETRDKYRGLRESAAFRAWKASQT